MSFLNLNAFWIILFGRQSDDQSLLYTKRNCFILNMCTTLPNFTKTFIVLIISILSYEYKSNSFSQFFRLLHYLNIVMDSTYNHSCCILYRYTIWHWITLLCNCFHQTKLRSLMKYTLNVIIWWFSLLMAARLTFRFCPLL